MSEINLKSSEFRREREGTWRVLAGLVEKAERGGLRSLTADELLRLPMLYRATLSSLSVARSISLDRQLLVFLESLAARAYFTVYGARAGLLPAIAKFFSHSFPDAVRAARWHILVAFLALVLGVATGFFITLGNGDWFYAFLSAESAQGRDPAAATHVLRAVLYDDNGGIAEELAAFAAFLFSNNARVGILAFALGFAFGIPVILLLFHNGLGLGALAAVYHTRGLSPDFWGWISIHGTTELFAIILCGAAGLVLGASLAFPGRHKRLDNLARNGPIAAQIIIGAVVMFFIAGLLEGFGRQLILLTTYRYLIGGTALSLLVVYFIRSGRRKSAAKVQ